MEKYYLLTKKFAYSRLGKAFGNQTKIIWDQSKKQMKVTEDHEKQLVESNGIAKNDFNIDRDGVPLSKKKKF